MIWGYHYFWKHPYIYIYCSHELSLLNLSMFVAKRQTVLISDTMRMNKRNHQNYTIDLLHEMIHWSRAKSMITKNHIHIYATRKTTNHNLTFKTTIFIYKSKKVDKYCIISNTLQGTITYPTERECRKIIDWNVPLGLVRGDTSSLWLPIMNFRYTPVN